MKPANLFHNNFLFSGFCGHDVLTDCIVSWYSSSTLLQVSGRFILSCWSIRPHSAWHSYQRSLSTSQPVPFQEHSLPGAVIFPFCAIITKKLESRAHCLMLSANTEISPLFCHSSLLRGIYPASKGTQAAFGLMTWI